MSPFTCRTVHNHNIISPEVRRVVFSIHLDVSKATCAWLSSRIIAPFASDMNVQERYCRNDINDRESVSDLHGTSATNCLFSIYCMRECPVNCQLHIIQCLIVHKDGHSRIEYIMFLILYLRGHDYGTQRLKG